MWFYFFLLCCCSAAVAFASEGLYTVLRERPRGAAAVQHGLWQPNTPFKAQLTQHRAPLGGDDETQFLNYILTKFANSQPEGQ